LLDDVDASDDLDTREYAGGEEEMEAAFALGLLKKLALAEYAASDEDAAAAAAAWTTKKKNRSAREATSRRPC